MHPYQHIQKSLAALALACLIAAPVANAGVLYQFGGSGDYVRVTNWSPERLVRVTLFDEVYNGVRTTRLLYWITAFGGPGKYWYGDIPSAAVTGSGTATVTITVDTCTINATAGCGVVDLSFNKNSDWANSEQGSWTQQVGAGDWLYHYNGARDYVSADVTGSVAGYALTIQNNRGTIGKYHSASVTVTDTN